MEQHNVSNIEALHNFLETIFESSFMDEGELFINQTFLNQEILENPTNKQFVDSLQAIQVDDTMIQKKETCCICQEYLQQGETIYELPCKHKFHVENTCECCGIKPWLEKQNTCPVCRYELPSEQPEQLEQSEQPEQLEQSEQPEQLEQNQENPMQIRIIQRIILPVNDTVPNYQETIENFQDQLYDMELQLAIERSLE